jgi:hypothetical protein
MQATLTCRRERVRGRERLSRRDWQRRGIATEATIGALVAWQREHLLQIRRVFRLVAQCGNAGIAHGPGGHAVIGTRP